MSIDTGLLTQLGVGATLAVVIIDKFIAFAKMNKDSNSSNKVDKCIQQIDEMYKWHNVKNIDGSFIWYQHASLEKTMERLANVMDLQVQVMQKILHNTETTIKDLERLE